MARKKDPKDNIKPVHVDVHGQRGYDKYPNQWEIITKRPKAKKPFASVEDRFAEWAMNDLKGEVFRLWYYMARNANDFQYSLSPRRVKDVTGMSKKTYDRAREQLIDKGYLIHSLEIRDCNSCGRKEFCEDFKFCKDVYYFSPVSKFRIGENNLKKYFKWCETTNESKFVYGDKDWKYIKQPTDLDFGENCSWYGYDSYEEDEYEDDDCFE